MSILRKKLEVKNRFPDIRVVESLSSKTSSWLSSIPFYRDFEKVYKNRNDVLKNSNSWKCPAGEAPITIRTCPGIRDLFNNSVLVKWPVDFIIHNNNNGEISWNCPDANLIRVSHHPAHQYESENFNFINFKVTLPVAITSNKLLNIVFLQPFYHNQNNLDVVLPPGVVSVMPSVDFELTINFMLPNTPKSYYFKKNEAIAYLYATEPFKLVNSNNQIRPYRRTKFFDDVKDK